MRELGIKSYVMVGLCIPKKPMRLIIASAFSTFSAQCVNRYGKVVMKMVKAGTKCRKSVFFKRESSCKTLLT
jgi:hypothetical protein